MNRKRLVEQYPSVRQISLPNGTINNPEALFRLVEPYLNWKLAQLEALSTDILIYEELTKGAYSQFLILRGYAANTWLRYRRSASAMA